MTENYCMYTDTTHLCEKFVKLKCKEIYLKGPCSDLAEERKLEVAEMKMLDGCVVLQG